MNNLANPAPTMRTKLWTKFIATYKGLCQQLKLEPSPRTNCGCWKHHQHVPHSSENRPLRVKIGDGILGSLVPCWSAVVSFIASLQVIPFSLFSCFSCACLAFPCLSLLFFAFLCLLLFLLFLLLLHLSCSSQLFYCISLLSCFLSSCGVLGLFPCCMHSMASDATKKNTK